MASPSRDTDAPPAAERRRWLPDVLASLVVFLVALPLCIGIAVACGVPAERGLVTGIIGGIIVGSFSGAPLLVSGPAASLIVPVFDLVRTHGLWALAPVVMLAGVWQAIAGILRLGQWYRAVAPAVIVGMLTGIGILICASQLHVAIDAEPSASFLRNITGFPAALARRFGGDGPGPAPVIVSIATIGLLIVWNRVRPRKVAIVPGHLVALLAVTVATLLLEPPVAFLDISPQFFAGLSPPSLDHFEILLDPEFIGISLVFAFVASAATLLTANAIDERQTHSKADYDREIFAQGIGNLLTGSVGGLPMTGVIVRSSVNVDAGARTRVSTILHGLWILLFVSLAPEVLELVPRASLGAILVYTGYRLLDVRAMAALYRQGRAELAICLITLFGVVFVDLFSGILAGLAAAVGKIVYTFARLEIRIEPSPSEPVQHLHLEGSATFLHIPRLAKVLETIPADRKLLVHIDRLDHIDHACLQLLSSWNRRRESESRPGMVVEWDELTERYRHAIVGAGARDSGPPPSLMSLVWAEWKRIYAPRNRDEAGSDPRWRDWIDASRVHVRARARRLDDVIPIAARLLAPAAERTEAELADALARRVEGHVALGGGVSIPHAPIVGLDRSLAALVITTRPVDVGGEPADLFFVLLAPADDPRQHLQSLAHVGRLAHDITLVAELRNAATPETAAELLAAFEDSLLDTDAHPAVHDRLLAAVEVEGDARAQHVAQLVDEAFGRTAVLSKNDEARFEVIRRVLGIRGSRRVVLVPIQDRDIGVLQALLAEEARLFRGEVCIVHVLRPETVTREPTAERPAAP